MTLSYLLDTNICIYLMKHQSQSIVERFSELSVGEVAISVITYGELQFGVQRSQFQAQSQKALAQFLQVVPALPMPVNAGQHYGIVRDTLSQSGKIIGNNDLWIASHALSQELILVTNNLREFKRVPDLRVENWV